MRKYWGFFILIAVAIPCRGSDFPEHAKLYYEQDADQPNATFPNRSVRWIGADHLGGEGYHFKRLTCWNEKGIRIQLSPPKSIPDRLKKHVSGGSEWRLEVFVDTRPRTAPLDRYEKGVFHFLAQNNGLTIIDSSGRALGAAPEACWLRTPEEADGDLVLFLSWTAIGADGFVPAVSSEIGLSVRLVLKDADRQTVISIGDKSVDSRNLLEDTPAAFDYAILQDLDSHTPPVPIEVSFVEKVLNNSSYIELKVLLESQQRLRQFGVKIGAMSESSEFSQEPDSNIYSGMIRIPLDRIALPNGSVCATIEIPELAWSSAYTVPLVVTPLLAEIDLAWSQLGARCLDRRQEPTLALLKSCAQETAAQAAYAWDGYRTPQKLARSLRSGGFYTPKIKLFINAAEKVLEGSGVYRNFPYLAWQSRIDGSWLPIKIVPPWNLDRTRKYPIRILLYGFSRLRTRAQFVEDDLLAMQEGSYYPALGEAYTVVLYGRGNFDLSTGAEELARLPELLHELPIDWERAGIYGGSAAAESALRVAMRHPDKFSWVLGRGGHYDNIILNPQEAALLSNLQTLQVSLCAGEFDPSSTRSSIRLREFLDKRRIVSVFQSVPNSYHSFAPQFWPASKPRVSQQERTFCVSDLDSPAIWGVRINAKLRDEIVHVSVTESEDSIRVRFDNVLSFSLDQKSLRGEGIFKQLFINDEIVDCSSDLGADRWMQFKRDGTRWIPSEGVLVSPEGPVKQTLLPGSLASTESNTVIIVYGTLSPKLRQVLQTRAYDIATSRSAVGLRTWAGRAYQIKADIELSDADKERANLWLVGGPAENLVSAEVWPLISRRSAFRINQSPNLDGLREHTLLSIAYPNPNVLGKMITMEVAGSPAAYRCDVVVDPDADFVIQSIETGTSKRLSSGKFDLEWKFIVPMGSL